MLGLRWVETVNMWVGNAWFKEGGECKWFEEGGDCKQVGGNAWFELGGECKEVGGEYWV